MKKICLRQWQNFLKKIEKILAKKFFSEIAKVGNWAEIYLENKKIASVREI